MNQPLIHPSVLCESSDIGAGTRIDAFTSVAKQVKLGQNSVIGPHVSIESDAIIGDRVIIEGFVHIGPRTVIEDDVSVAAHVTFSAPDSFLSGTAVNDPIILRRGCKIGANATLSAGITIGEDSVVNAGAVVTRSVQPYAIVAGNPAVVVGFLGTAASKPRAAANSSSLVKSTESRVKGVRTYELPLIRDPRGNLTVGEFERTLPFIPRRFFMTLDVPSADLRGEHAHRTCHQFLLCVFGSCAVVVDDGINREEFLLDRPTFGVYIPPMVWATEYKHSSDSRLLVFASEYYDPAEYIRNYRSFLDGTAAI